MTELERSAVTRRVHRLRGQLADRWSPAREALIGRQLERSVRRRAQLRRAGVAAIVLAILVGAGGAWLRHDRALVLADGSRVERLQPRAAIVEVASARERRVRLDGPARFDVRPDPTRPFVVELAQGLEVRVLGTVFTVEPDRDVVTVAVERGHVLVQRRGQTLADLQKGDRARVPLVEAAPAPPPPEPAPEPEPVAPEPIAAPELPPARPRVEPARPRPAPPDWRALAESGDYQAAFAALGDRELEGVEALLLAADVARLSGHPRESVEALQKIEARHGTDPRAPLAAFTRGRVLLEDLGRPREAAQAFEHAGALDPAGPLVADALAREVEAWSRAGDRAAAHARAEAYVKRFPTGARLRGVRLYGDLD